MKRYWIVAAVVALLLAGVAGRMLMHRPAEPEAALGSTPARILYTCGMHPEVISETPGNCPKCGMKLVPMDPDRASMILETRGEKVAAAAAADERKILYWRAPMDPTYIRDEPGKSPMGMDLVPVYEDEVAGGPSIRIDPVTEQNMGVRYAEVHQGPLNQSIRTVGTVEYDENSLGTVTTKNNGWVEKVYVRETGAQVHKGDPLFELYSPELFSAQEEYLTARRDQQQAASGAATELAQTRWRAARERLKLFDITEDQIKHLEETGEQKKTLTITAQLTGIVTQRNVTEGDAIESGQPAYRIADLSTVWVRGKVYESDMPFIELGQEALMTLDYLPGRTYRGRVTYIYPYLEEGTREVPVRMEFHNPGYDLKPGMYATIRIDAALDRQAVLVPASAVIATGERQIVFVSEGAGKFQPRSVRTGLRNSSDELQVLEGLAPGERVVVSGQFLLDSESRLREATLKMLHPAMENGGSTTRHSVGDSHEMPMEENSQAAQTKYVCPMPGHAGVLYDQPGNCPLCGMKMVPTREHAENGDKIDHWTCPMPEHYHIEADRGGKCPECGMTLIPVTTKAMERFEENVAGAGSTQPSTQPALYTCPMSEHAHVVSDKPGDCPECGMKLVPTGEVAHGEKAEAAWKARQP